VLTGLDFRAVRWTDEAATVTVAKLDTEFQLLPLLKREVRINSVAIDNVDITIGERQASEAETEPLSIDLPIKLVLETASIRNLRISMAQGDFVIDRVTLDGQLAGSTLRVGNFDVQSELGDISLAGDAELRDDYAANATAAWELRRPNEAPLSGILALQGDASRYDVQHELDAPFEIATAGTLALIDGRLTIDLTNSWRRIVIERGEALAPEATDGVLRLSGSFDELFFGGSTNVVVGDIPAVALETRGKLVDDRVELDSLSLANAWGALTASGEILLAAQTSWSFDVALSNLDPGVLDPRLTGNLGATLKTTGRLVDSMPRLDVNVASFAGNLNGYPVDGKGKIAYASEQLKFRDAVVRVGDNRLDFDGTYGQRLQLEARARLSDLGQFGVGAAGVLNGDVRLVTDAQTFAASGNVSGQSLAWDKYYIDHFDADFKLPTKGDGSIAVQASSEEHGSVTAEIDGRFVDQQWSGTIRKLALLRDPVGEWTLQEPATIRLSRSRLDLGKTCLGTSAVRGSVCASLDFDYSGPLRFEASVDALPVAALRRNLPEGATLLGELRAAANGEFTNGLLNSSISVQLDGLGLIATFEGDEVAANFSTARADTTIVNNKLNGNFEFRLDNDVDYAAGSIEVADLFDLRSALVGEGSLEFNDLALLSFFVPDLANPVGKIFGRIDAAGSLAMPEIVGEIGLSNGSADIRRAGISVADVEFLLQQEKAGELALQGSAKSGNGYLNITGRTAIGAETGIRTEIRLNGEDFNLIRLPDLQASASPNIAVLFDERATRVTGELLIPTANIAVKSVPEATQKPSSDAVVHRGDESIKQPQRQLFVDVKTELGDQVFFSGFGLTTGLGGSVRITGDNKSPYRGFGRVVLREGRYRAYGQILEIENGELFFNGPLANPALSVRATRTASDGTIAGIHLTGTPSALNSVVYSEPAMGDAEALSYLLTGRPLNNANSEEGDMLNQAAFALGLTGAGKVASQIRNQLGLETLGIQGTAENRQLVAGKRIGGRLFVEYAYGVVDSLGTLLLRYQLTQRLMVESRSGSVRTVDVVYSVKKP
jgi:translocation and assembly module TamB